LSLPSDEHGGPRTRPVRAVRPRSASEKTFLGLGHAAGEFLRAAAAAGTPRLATEIEAINRLAAAWDPDAVCLALARALAFRRFTGRDVASILQAQAAELLEDAVEDILAHMHFPFEHRRRLHSANPIEWLHGTQFAQQLPDEALCSTSTVKLSLSMSRQGYQWSVPAPPLPLSWLSPS
jgi:hypothetical protein